MQDSRDGVLVPVTLQASEGECVLPAFKSVGRI